MRTSSGCVHLPRQHDRLALAEAGSEHRDAFCHGAEEITRRLETGASETLLNELPAAWTQRKPSLVFRVLENV